MRLRADIVDYMGKYHNGVMVLLNITMVGVGNFEGTIFYTDDNLALTVNSEIETHLGCKIEECSEYPDLVKSILNRLRPCSEVINSLKDVNFEEYTSFYEEDFNKFVDSGLDESK